MRDDGPRLLVNWKDGFANFRARGPVAPLKDASSTREVRLLVDWSDSFANYRPGSAPPPPVEYVPSDAPLGFLVEWEDELAAARHRETVMAAVILHLAFVLFLVFHPQIFPERQLTPEEAEAQAREQLSLLYLPGDLLKLPEKEPELTPEERRRATIRAPLKIDPRELERILPPPGLPGPPGPSGAPVPPSSGESREPTSPSRTESNDSQSQRQTARLEDLPRPSRSSDSNLALPQTSPGRSLEESLRRTQPGVGGGQGGEGGPIQLDLNTPFPVILSDTRGVDFGPYLIRLLREVKRNWYAVIPESVRWGEQGRVVIIFTINKDGSVPVGQPTIVRSSGRSHLDRPALGSIRASQPLPPLPSEFTGDNIVLQFTFLYNLPVDYSVP